MIPLLEDLLLGKAADWVWQASLAGAVLAALVLVLQSVLRRRLAPQWRYGLWLLVVARLLMPIAPASSLSLFNWIGWPTERTEAPASFVGQGTLGAVETPAQLRHEPPPTSEVAAATEAGATFSENVSRTASMSWRIVLAWVWLAGAVSYWLFLLVQHRRFAAQLKHDHAVTDARILSILEACKADLRVRTLVQIVETTRVSTPAVFGCMRPRLLLPAPLESWDATELRHVILHELVHIRRHDVLLNWILILAQGLHWFNPAVWFALRRLRAEREVLCDATVLPCLQPTEHRAYGATLLKLVRAISKPVRLPSLAPVLNNPNELERRMTMITQFKPSTRRVAFAGSALLLVLACFTFTRAAEKAAPVPTQPDPTESDARRKAEATQRERSIRVLEEELAKQRDQVRSKQSELDVLKEKLMITELDAAGAAAISADSLRQLESERISTTSEYRRLDSLCHQLEKFSKKELRALLPTASPDPLLNRLLEEEAITDQKLAESGEVKSLSHPEVAGLQRRRERIEKQIDERIDGIMAGLKTRLAGLRVQQEVFQAELDQLKKKSIEETISRQPYYQAKRDLENLQSVLERLNARLWQEKVDAALPKVPGVQ